MKLSLIATAVVAMGTASAGDYFPLATGNNWTYRDATTGQTVQIRVGLPALIDQKVYHFVDGFGPTKLPLRVNEYGTLAYWDEERGYELPVSSFTVGPDFAANGRQCPSWGRVNSKPVEYAGPAGRWSALAVDFTPYGCADAGELQELYADNIGMVRRVVSTIAGPRTLDLVYARVGKQVISAGDAGRFSVTALAGIDGGSWEVTLRVEAFANGAVPVTFPSGQEFDMRLRDAGGNIVWTWSANKLFTAATHTVTDIGGWTASDSVPFPPHVGGETLRYTLEAWLTTGPDGPQFAATVPLELVTAPSESAPTRPLRR